VKRWWIRPLVRLIAALALPVIVPAVITGFIWALPGDPASLICPPNVCGGTEALAERWNLDGGPVQFFVGWVGDAVHLEFGNSWRLHQGLPVLELLSGAIPTTLTLLGLATVVVMTGALLAAKGWIPEKLDTIIRFVGLVPALVLALVGAAFIELTYGFDSFSGSGQWARLAVGSAVLGLADGAFTGAVMGTRATFQAEFLQRYVGIATLRGERRMENTLPNVAPALIGQMRARIIHLLSGAVVVEVVLRIDGIGDLLWGGTLRQDFGVVLAAATIFGALSSVLLIGQAVLETMVALHVRRAPSGVRVGEVS
jgi:ABC-type dipeptide/oligopeptide/nickel transport system permease component